MRAYGWPWRVVVALLVVARVRGAASAQPAPVVLDAILATVNGQVISASDVRAAQQLSAVPASSAAETVARLVDRVLMLDEVERAGQANPTPEQVDARRSELVSRHGVTQARLQARDGMTDRRLLAWLRDDLRIEAYLSQRFTAAAQPTDEEVAAFFTTNAARFTQPGAPADDPGTTARARVALVEARRQSLIDTWLDGLRRRADIVATPR